MEVIVRLYSNTENEIQKFLTHFYGNNIETKNITIKNNEWQQNYPNPIEIVDIIGAYIENIEDFNLTMWISLDTNVFIKVTPDNADDLIRYLYERFPY